MIRLSPLLLGPILLALACSSLPPEEQAQRQSHQRIALAVDAGLDAADPSQPHTVYLRYNPCNCPAPDHELLLYGQWQRTILDGDPTLLDNLHQLTTTAHHQPGLHRWRIQGYLDGETTSDGAPENAPTYPRFILLDLSPP